MKDGSSLYSKRVAVQPLSAGSEKALSIISVSPNPFSETLKINLQVPIDESLMITIWSTDGKLLRTQEESFQKGSQQIELNSLDAMPAGNYILKVSGGNQNTSKNIIKY
ncbi:MAG: T9SS type A sorting domain-containing protein [Bacteroidia bacterium]